MIGKETKKMSVIRKISIGSDYKNDAMHYSLDQEVYGGHRISDILLLNFFQGKTSLDFVIYMLYELS